MNIYRDYDESLNLNHKDIKFKKGERVFVAEYAYNDWDHQNDINETTKITNLSTCVIELNVTSVMRRKTWKGSKDTLCKITVRRDETTKETMHHSYAVRELAKSPEGALRKLITKLKASQVEFEERLKWYNKTPYDSTDGLSWSPDECVLYIKTYKRLITLANKRIKSVKDKREADKVLERKRKEFSKTWKNNKK